jgi:hypothetical protein
MSDVTDLLTHTVNKSPVEFADAFNNIMQQKAIDAIEAHRVTLAQSIYNTADDENEDEGIDDDDQLDLDDIDLDDIDLEDIDDLMTDLDDDNDTDEDTTDDEA